MTIDIPGTHDGHPDRCKATWYVTDPSTGLTQYVKDDAEHTARWRASSGRRGAMPATAHEDARGRPAGLPARGARAGGAGVTAKARSRLTRSAGTLRSDPNPPVDPGNADGLAIGED